MEARAPDPSLAEFRLHLRRLGFPGRETEELAGEWADHLEDLREHLASTGFPAHLVDAEARSRMGSPEAIAAEHARLRRDHSFVGRFPLAMSLLLPVALAYALAAAGVGISGACSRILQGLGLHAAFLAMAGFPPLMAWIVPTACQACGAVLLYLAFTRSFCGPFWCLLSSLIFSWLAGAVSWNLVPNPPGTPLGYALTVAFELSTRPRIGSLSEELRASVPLFLALCFLAAARLRRASGALTAPLVPMSSPPGPPASDGRPEWMAVRRRMR